MTGLIQYVSLTVSNVSDQNISFVSLREASGGHKPANQSVLWQAFLWFFNGLNTLWMQKENEDLHPRHYWLKVLQIEMYL